MEDLNNIINRFDPVHMWKTLHTVIISNSIINHLIIIKL